MTLFYFQTTLIKKYHAVAKLPSRLKEQSRRLQKQNSTDVSRIVPLYLYYDQILSTEGDYNIYLKPDLRFEKQLCD